LRNLRIRLISTHDNNEIKESSWEWTIAGDRLRKARVSTGMTKEEFAAVTEISRTTVANLVLHGVTLQAALFTNVGALLQMYL
jgi:DNA-binding XRE family transcriptional regulator